jgi:hypothetical protein
MKKTRKMKRTTCKNVVTIKSLELDKENDFNDIKKRIESDYTYAGLEKLCRFHLKEKRIDYLTESIYPNREKNPDRIPVLFLFSNPYPDSVSRCLFLSEPHSRSFWKRLSESHHFKDMKLKQLVKDWDDLTTPKRIAQFMLEGEYKSRFLLYFHCLWPIPTNQFGDLKRLFKGKEELWNEKVDKVSKEELHYLIEDCDIKHIVVFPSAIFNEITLKIAPKGWRKSIKDAVDTFDKDRNITRYWECLSGGYAQYKSSSDVHVYLALDTRRKDWGKGMDKRYFTWAIDMILDRILRQVS